MNRGKVIIGCMGVLLMGTAAAGLLMQRDGQERIKALESELSVLRKQEEQSLVDRRVSQQLEKIAYGQEERAEERSREAIRQSEIAQEMTLRSEAERKRALQAQAAAEVSAEEARRSYQLAEHQRMAAEEAKLVADSLNYISLGRSLGSQSYAVYRGGDKDLGTLLAYASYYYTYHYGGNLYSSSVYQALTQAAVGLRSWNTHSSRISGIDISPVDGSLLSVSTYGEMQVHKVQGGYLKTISLINDKNYCFRDVYAARNGKGYAVSHTGHLVVVGGTRNEEGGRRNERRGTRNEEGGTRKEERGRRNEDGERVRVVYLENVVKPFNLQAMNEGRQLLIIGENSMALFDMATEKVVSTRRLDFKVTCTGLMDNRPLLFDSRGRMHQVNSIDNMKTSKVPVSGQVTAFVNNAAGQLKAYGMDDGTIWLVYDSGKLRKLAGHQSKVTKLLFFDEGHGKQLYSSSYDGKLFFWMTSDMQIRPITLFQADSWLTDFAFSRDKNYIWTSEYSGSVNEHLISLPMIAQYIRQKVKRDFTPEEWNYYVGKEIPYRRFLGNSE